jgi:hypothetical protein
VAPVAPNTVPGSQLDPFQIADCPAVAPFWPICDHWIMNAVEGAAAATITDATVTGVALVGTRQVCVEPSGQVAV